MKKFFRMVMAFSLIGGMLAFSGCTDYEDDINKLDDRLTKLEQTVDELQSAIDGGAVITGVTQSENGVTVTLSNGQSFTLTNGADGAAGSVVEIGEDGYWYIDGVKTEYPATGEGADAPTVYYVPGTEGDEEGFWVKVTEEEGKEPVRETTDITWLPEGTVTAVWNAETQTLYVYNVKGADGEPVVISASTGMVTSVELIYSNAYASGLYHITYDVDKDGTLETVPVSFFNTPELNFTSIIEKENVFEEAGWDKQTIANPIVFKKDVQQQLAAGVLVRVSPANVKLTADMISFVNSQGENLDDFLTVGTPQKYTGLLTKAAVNSGLWVVPVALKEYDKDEFLTKQYAYPTLKRGEILYALQVNNTTESDSERYVTSSYDITLAYEDYQPDGQLNFVVANEDNYEHVADINNRYTFTSESLPKYSGTDTPAKEYTWLDNPSTTPVFSSDQGTVNTIIDTPDDRSSMKAFPAVQGEPFVISLCKEAKKSDINPSYGPTSPNAIRAMYVTLDKSTNAVESAPSEWNAWNSYVYTGLNTVVEGTAVTITVNPGAGQTIIDDYIGFRVFAVNWDGTLVDPDGKAFYVKVGNSSADWNAVMTTITPNADDSKGPHVTSSSNSATSGLTELKAESFTATWIDPADPDAGRPVFDVYFKKENTEFWNTTSVSNTATTVSFSPATKKFNEVTALYTMPSDPDKDEWWEYDDDKAYYGTLTIYNEDNFVLASITVAMTKKLPGQPEGFSVKSAQLDASGVYDCYLVPETWEAPKANNGTMDMDHVFNWGKGMSDQYIVSFAAAKKDANNKDVANDVAGNLDLEVAKTYINNETQHPTTVSYNYGDISSVQHEAAKNANKLGTAVNAHRNYEDYVVEVKTFPTVFNCIYNDTYDWHWATIEELTAADKDGWFVNDGKGNNAAKAPSTELVYGTDYQMQKATANDTDPKYISIDQVVLGVSTRDGGYNAWLWQPYGIGVDENGQIPGASLQWDKAEIISNGNKEVNEYFKVVGTPGVDLKFEATKTSTETNPTEDVPSTLKLYYKDMYGHDVVVDLPLTVKKR